MATARPCKHCGKIRGFHKAVTLACPVGMKTRVGYCQYHDFETYEPRPTRKKKGTT